MARRRIAASLVILALIPLGTSDARPGNPPGEATHGAVRSLFILPEHDCYPENIAYDPVTGCYFLGSMSRSRILRIHPDGSYEEFLASTGTGLLSSIGLAVDVPRRVLWVCSGRFSLYADYESAPARTGLFQFDLENGTLLGSWTLPQESDYHIFNDLVVAANGDVYATTTLMGKVYRLPRGGDELELIHQLPAGSHNNGIAFGPGEKCLYLTVDRTISRLDLETGEMTELVTAQGEALGADGIYFHRGALIVVKPRFDQVVRLVLDDRGTSVIAAETLLQDYPDLAYPTTGTLVDDRLVLVATSFATVPRKPDTADQHPDVRILEIDL